MRINHSVMNKLNYTQPSKAFLNLVEETKTPQAVVTIPQAFHKFDEFYSNHREHQKNTCDFLKDKTIAQVSIPTGTGKTRIQVSEHITNMIEKTKQKESGVYVIGAHRLLLCRQLLDELMDEAHKCGLAFDLLLVGSARLNENDVYEEYEGLNKANCKVTYTLFQDEVERVTQLAKKNKRHLLVVCTYHSFKKLQSITKIDVCTYDEAHTLTAKTFQENIETIKPNIGKNFFFTATRKIRKGGKGGMDDKDIFGSDVYTESPRDMINKGEIVAPKLHIIKALGEGNYDNDTMHARVIEGAFIKHKAMLNKDLGAKILLSTSGRKQLFNIYHNENFQAWCKDNNVRTIVFSSSQESDEGYFVDFKQVSRQEAFKQLKQLKDNEDALLLHIEILTEGIDLPSITAVMPFRSFERGKLFQTIGRAARLLKTDRTRLYNGEIKANELDKFIKPYCYVILPEDFKHLVNYDEMKSILRSVLNNYEMPIDELVIEDEYIADSTNPPERVTPNDSSRNLHQVCNIEQVIEDIICEDVVNVLENEEAPFEYIEDELSQLA